MSETIDPNTVEELRRARADLTSKNEEIKRYREEVARLQGERENDRRERETDRKERDEAIKSRDGMSGKLKQMQSDHEKSLGEKDAALEAARKESAEALAGVKSATDRAVIEAEARSEAVRMGAHSPADLVRLLDLSGVTRDEDGKISGLTEVLEAAKAAPERAYLFGEPIKTGVQTGTTQSVRSPGPGKEGPVDARKMTDAEHKAALATFLAANR